MVKELFLQMNQMLYSYIFQMDQILLKFSILKGQKISQNNKIFKGVVLVVFTAQNLNNGNISKEPFSKGDLQTRSSSPKALSYLLVY